MSTNETDQRQFARIHFEVPVALTQGDQRWEGQLLDISLRGMLLRDPAPPALDDEAPVDVTIELSEQAVITMHTHVAHRGANDVIGLKCDTIDTDSLGFLHRLIELNIGDARQAERELAEMLHPAL